MFQIQNLNLKSKLTIVRVSMQKKNIRRKIIINLVLYGADAKGLVKELFSFHNERKIEYYSRTKRKVI